MDTVIIIAAVAIGDALLFWKLKKAQPRKWRRR